MTLISLSGVLSTSAPTKAQKDAAIYMFGSKGHSIVAILDKFSRAKEIRAPHLDGLLKLMKEGEDDEIIKYNASAVGKKTVAAAKQFATAKTLAASIKALRLIKVPAKWIDGHSDVAAARNEETKEIRARRSAGNKPEKPIKLDNPSAPAPEDVSPAAVFDAAFKARNTEPFEAVHKAVRVVAKKYGLTTKLSMTILGSSSIVLQMGSGAEAEILFPSNSRKLKQLRDDPNQFFMTAQNSIEVTLATDFVTATMKNAPRIVAKAFDVLWKKAMASGAAQSKEKEVVAKPYKPSGKSDVSLVDEMAEVPARKIAAKSLREREEYFTALRNVLQKNLPKMTVATVSNGVTVVGKRDYVVTLDNNAWNIKVGVTGKPKRIGATFDIVDLLGMLDKSILRPKPEGGPAQPEPPYFDQVQIVGGEYSTAVHTKEGQTFPVRFKREGDKFVFSTMVYSDVQHFITQGMEKTKIMWETFTGRSVTFSKADADKFERWVKSIKRPQALTSNKTFPAIAPLPKGMSMTD